MVGSPDGDLTLGRRTILQGVGAGALAWSSLTGSSDRVAADNHDGESSGMLVLIYDDSPRSDYSMAFPIHEEYGVPGCVAAVPGFMGSHSRWMHPGHVEELYEAGWEVMSKSMEHRLLGEVPVRGDIEEGDTEIVVQTNHNGRFTGDPLVVYDGDKQTEVTIAGADSEGDTDLLLLEEPIDESFSAGDGWTTYVRFPDDLIDEVLADSKAQLEEWGFDPVTTFVLPFNRHDGYVSEAVPDHYDALANRRSTGLNPTFDPDPYNLGRQNFEEDHMSEEDLAGFLDSVANEPDFGILYGHTRRDAMTEDRIETVIQMAQERDIEIVTLQTALERLREEDSPDDEGGGQDDDVDDTDDLGGDDDDGTGDDSSGTGFPLQERIQSVVGRIEVAIRNVIGRIGSIFS